MAAIFSDGFDCLDPIEGKVWKTDEQNQKPLTAAQKKALSMKQQAAELYKKPYDKWVIDKLYPGSLGELSPNASKNFVVEKYYPTGKGSGGWLKPGGPAQYNIKTYFNNPQNGKPWTAMDLGYSASKSAPQPTIYELYQKTTTECYLRVRKGGWTINLGRVVNMNINSHTHKYYLDNGMEITSYASEVKIVLNQQPKKKVIVKKSAKEGAITLWGKPYPLNPVTGQPWTDAEQKELFVYGTINGQAVSEFLAKENV